MKGCDFSQKDIQLFILVSMRFFCLLA